MPDRERDKISPLCFKSPWLEPVLFDEKNKN